VWALVRILNVRLRFIALMVVVGLVAGYWENITNYYDRWRRPPQLAAGTHTEEVEYFCPMHPSVVRDAPGNCPICGMPLSQRPRSGAPALPAGVLARVELTPLKVSLGRIGTTPVEYRLLSRAIRTVGFVDYDETRRAFIASRIKGRIEKLFVNYVGQRVEQGEPLVSIYSPDLLVGQEELLSAARTVEAQRGTAEMVRQSAQRLLDAARTKLLLWGITAEQIDELIRRGTPETTLTIYSPLSGIVIDKKVLEGHYVNEGDDLYTIADLSDVWLQAQIFEDQAAGIQVGTAVAVTTTAFPDDLFAGRIAFVAFAVDPETRTVAARVEVANPELRLKPGMYVHAVIRLPVGAVTVLDAESRPAETAPAAPRLDTRSFVGAYLRWMAAYAADKADAEAAAQVAREAHALAEQTEGNAKAAAQVIAGAAERLRGKELKEQRTLLKELNARVLEFLRQHPPGEPELFVAHCPMVNADWVQDVKEISNPYYGSEMLRCGEITGPLAGGEPRGGERFAIGYFCPIYPDRLFDKPQHCPVDKFPTRLARVEKVLAVPESAVVNTGTRRIVYREGAPGVFDMVEVELGPRAGEFFPVRSGLVAGDQVATAGAFLVDAENRLNPAASAQYFGASGGPQGDGHQH
jgi:multidrug efflux pump subunit AcrA (membrane-fusion protein)